MPESRIGVLTDYGAGGLRNSDAMGAISEKTLIGAGYEEVTVGEVMHPGVIVCGPESPVRYAADLMARHHVHAIVVWGDDEEGGPWGVVADTDILAAFGRRELDGSAGAIAKTPMITVSASDGVLHAADLMRRHHVTHLVVTARRRPVGVVSTLDLARAAASGIGIV